jgi:HSP20 family protein
MRPCDRTPHSQAALDVRRGTSHNPEPKGHHMSLTLWKKRSPVSIDSPFNGDLARFREEMDRTFDRFFSEPLGYGFVEPKSLRAEDSFPALDVSETDTEITVRAEVPGIPAKDLNVSVSGTTLTISGEKEESSEKKDENYYQCERRFGSFRRVIDLPDTIDADKISADSDNGVVTIHIAKKPGPKPKQVEVKPAVKKVPVATG